MHVEGHNTMKPPADPIIPGAIIEVAHPFLREKYHGMDADGPFDTMTWRPGIRHEQCAQDDYEAVADAIGTQIITIISTHKPGRFPERVFFTRKWRDPSGREFGKTKLHTKAVQAFRVLIKGYRHGFRVVDPAESAMTSTQG